MRGRAAKSIGTGQPIRVGLLVGVLLLGTCNPPEMEVTSTVQRISYDTLPGIEGIRLEPSLRIGEIDGDEHAVFGDVRSVEVDEYGALYILDHQSSEVRVFDPNGSYLRTLTGKGEGPGELVAANGMVFSEEGVLWIHDHGQWRMVGMDRRGEEVGREPIQVLSFGWFWDGAVDHEGRFWKPTSSPIGDRSGALEVGLQETRARLYMSWYDPEREVTDSLFLGTRTGRAYFSDVGGPRYFPIPFAATPLAVLDPAGGIWTAAEGEYRIARLNEGGDTLLIIDVDLEPQAVTAEGRERFLRDFLPDDPDGRRIGESLIRHAPRSYPVVDQLFVDDEGRLWVRRFRVGGGPRYDVFTRGGEYVTSVRLGFEPLDDLPPRVRDGHLYAVAPDDLGVQTVVKAELASVSDVW